MINWHVSKTDHRAIEKIAYRAADLFRSFGHEVTPSQIMMDVTATHATSNPLRLDDLAEAEQFDFLHDIAGIYRNLDRETGKLQNCFVPRYSA